MSAAEIELPHPPGYNQTFEEVYSFMTSGDEACQILNESDCDSFVPAKWKTDIGFRVFIEVNNDEDIEAVTEGISSFKKFASHATNGKIGFSNSVENIFLYIGGDGYRDTLRNGGGSFPKDTFLKMESAVTSKDCFAVITSINGEIISSSIFIPQSIPTTKIKRCVLEELYNSTGVFRDPPGAESIFSNEAKRSSYKYHPYSPLLEDVLRRFYTSN